MTTYLLGLFLCSCSASVANVVTVREHTNRLHINERWIKGTEGDGKNYHFVETLLYDFESDEFSAKDLTIRKTICIGEDCRTSRKHRLKSRNANRVKTIFDVDAESLKNQLTVITDILLKGTTLASYSYRFYPKDCIRKTCRQTLD